MFYFILTRDEKITQFAKDTKNKIYRHNRSTWIKILYFAVTTYGAFGQSHADDERVITTLRTLALGLLHK